MGEVMMDPLKLLMIVICLSAVFCDPGDYKYIGCYEDKEPRDLNGLFTSGPNSIDACARFCAQVNFKYFGVQNGIQCYCGNSYGRYSKKSNLECSARCSGNTTQVCGGILRNSVYEITNMESLVAIADSTHIGCYEDQILKDLNGLSVNLDGLTRTSCIKNCQGKNYRYAGMSGGLICNCGNSYGRYSRRNLTECSVKCLGNVFSNCGGILRNTIYRTNADNSIGDIEKVEYLGCYKDQADRDLSGKFFSGNSVTQQSCVKFCLDNGFLFAGVQFSSQCFCGNSFGNYGKVDESECQMKCSGDNVQKCGGSYRNNVFRVSVAQLPTIANLEGAEYLGCYEDNNNRDLDGALFESSSSLTQNFCIDYCRKLNFPYASVQAGYQCFCGDSFGKYNKKAESECSSKCSGNNLQSCGGGWRNSVFRINTVPLKPAGTIDGALYLGCFLDANDRDLNLAQITLANNTRSECIKYCRSINAFYAGVQGGSLCFCGNSYGRYNKTNEQECNSKCSGNRIQNCGGSYRSNIYRVSDMDSISSFSQSEYLGCYEDQKERDLNGASFRSDLMTQRICAKFCISKEYIYSGVQSNSECYCANFYGKYRKRPESECLLRCSGNSTESCGGFMRNNVFRASTTEQAFRMNVEASEYMGCYVDRNSRDLNGPSFNSTSMTQKACIDYCKSLSYPFAGLQSGRFCFCGTQFGKYEQKSDNECSSRCAGNNFFFCGGGWRNSIYRITSIPIPLEVLPSVTNGKFLGCFIDQSSRDISKKYIEFRTNNTHQECVNFCRDQYLPYAGIQYGYQCFCGDSYGKYGQANSRDCDVACPGNSTQMCGGGWRNSVFEVAVLPDPCLANPSPCGIGAICKRLPGGLAQCSCPPGTTGNATIRCCKSISCGCWGDPHCHSFDGAPFEFQGRCKYDLITTDCVNKALPNGLVPFSVKQKQEGRAGVGNAANVAFVRQLEINVYNQIYVLLKKVNGTYVYTVNGLLRQGAFTDSNGVNIYIAGGRLFFTAPFGLVITWDGDNRADVQLCSAYSSYVCGLCGNADGVPANDYVDRNNVIVPLVGNRYTQYFAWGSTWRVPDDSIDINNSTCNPSNPPGTPGPIGCKDPTIYDGNGWCGLISSSSGPWATCIQNINASLISGILTGCSFDMCALEGSTAQAEFRCNVYEKFTDQCYTIAKNLGLTWLINWRTVTNCPAKCSDNQVYELRSECTKTCLNPEGDYDCGEKRPVEGCYCKDGFVLDSTNKCILKDKCGCTLPDGSGTIQVGRVLKSSDCRAEFKCEVPQSSVKVTFLPACSIAADCLPDSNNQPICTCKQGFSGDGFNCTRKFEPSYPDTKYLGCYKDKPTRDLNGKSTQHPTQNQYQFCIDFCRNNKYKYAGLQFGSQCFCGNSYGSYGQIDESNCYMECTGNNTQACGGSWAQNIFEILPKPVTENPDPCLRKPSPCGFGANCQNVNGKPVCTCPAGKSGNPAVRCCKSITCGCSGDPHCNSFDNAHFDFMGRCKYDLVTTDCRNSSLPEGLVPFSVQQKQEGRPGVPNAANVAFFSYIDINAYGNRYRLLKKEKTHRFSINGILGVPSYSDDKVNIFVSGGDLVFTTNFGLSITWNGNHRAYISICDIYSKYVCGLCGNADGILANDYVDRDNKIVPLIGTRYTKYFKWGSKWKASGDESSIDIDNSKCAPNVPVGTIAGPACNNPTLYDSNEWCGLIQNKTGPWQDCLKEIEAQTVTSLTFACNFDMCALEGNKTQLEEFRCAAYEELSSICYGLSYKLNLNWKFNWREPTNCPKTCKPNQILDVRKECPKTCLNPEGTGDCGELIPVEGCYCKEGFVLNSDGDCIPVEQCGCTIPDGNFIIPVGRTMRSFDCKSEYTCDGPQQKALIKELRACSNNSRCVADQNNQPICVCNLGYTGDGYICIENPFKVPTTIEPTKPFNPQVDEKCQDSEKQCYVFGDPHYITFDNFLFAINNECTYLIASDNCLENQESYYQVFADHKYREGNTSVAFLSSITIKYGKNDYKITDKLNINGVTIDLPYESIDDDVDVASNDKSISFSTKFFTVEYDGSDFFKFYQCNANVCGLCGTQNGVDFKHTSEINEYLVNDNTKGVCSSNVKFPKIKN